MQRLVPFANAKAYHRLCLQAAVAALSPDAETRLHFPVLIKSIVAHGSERAHHMAIVFEAAGLAEVAYPCVLQQFVNHDAVVFKVRETGKT